MTGPTILFSLAAAGILYAVESSFQKITWRNFPPIWIADLALLFGAAGMVLELIVGTFKPGWPVSTFAAGAAAIVFFCHRRIL